MIKVRVFTDKEWLNFSCISSEKHEYSAWNAKSYFKNLLDTAWEDEPRIPFRDAESLQFLKETYDITFVSDEDWYSVICEGSRSDITCLYESIQFGLAAIDISKKGVYTQFQRAEEKIWTVLANLPIDILIAMRISKMGLFGEHISGTDYLIENYPYRGQAIEVFVKQWIVEKDFYTPVPEYRENNTNHGLHTGRDGKYYSDETVIPYAFQYYWKNDMEGIIKKIEELRKDRIVIADTTRTFDIFELGQLLSHDKNCIMMLDYLNDLKWISDDEKQGNCIHCHNGRQSKECYDEYLYFRDKFRVISHLVVAPKPWHRKLPVMMVDKNNDGTYFVHGGLTVKNPEFHELFYEVITGRSTERERFILIVDVEELLESVHDIKEAVCGFHVLADSVHVYDSYEGTQMFGEALKEAYYSGKCIIDTDFYSCEQ